MGRQAFTKADLDRALAVAVERGLTRHRPTTQQRGDDMTDQHAERLDTPAPPTPAEPAGDVLREALESIRDMKTELTSSHDYSRGWNAALFRARQLADAALSAAPAPQPDPDREALANLITDAELAWQSRGPHTGPTKSLAIADALLTRGLRLPTDEGDK